jgi:hypothetical protein
MHHRPHPITADLKNVEAVTGAEVFGFASRARTVPERLVEALCIWDEYERGNMDNRFMLAVIAEHTTHVYAGVPTLTLVSYITLPAAVQAAPLALFQEMPKLSPENIRRVTPAVGAAFRPAGFAFFIHTWALTGPAAQDKAAGRYKGTAAEHPSGERTRMMAAHYGGHTVTLARTASADLAIPVPAATLDQLIPALEAAAATLAASHR